jgi:hypothetical protein
MQMRLTSKAVSGFHSSFLIPGLRDLVWVSASSAVATFCLLFRTRLFCTGNSSMPRLHTPRDAAQILGISYPSLKQWIYSGKLKTVQTPAVTIGYRNLKSTACCFLSSRQ